VSNTEQREPLIRAILLLGTAPKRMRPMASLLYTCPETRQQVPTGIQIDAKSLRKAWSKKLKVQCPCCGHTHEMLVRETYIDHALQDVLGPRH
jgi:hypothetical protein